METGTNMNKKQPMKKPEKKIEIEFNQDPFLQGNGTLNIPPPIKKYGEEKNLHFRWLDSKTLYEQQGYHPKGWKVFVLPEGMMLAQDKLKFGKDPEGVVRRGSLILGYKTKENAKTHRAWLDQRAAQQRGEDVKKAQEIREQARKNKLDIVVHDGYEENG